MVKAEAHDLKDWYRTGSCSCCFLDAGMRIGEALGLRHEDLSIVERQVAVVARDNANGAVPRVADDVAHRPGSRQGYPLKMESGVAYQGTISKPRLPTNRSVQCSDEMRGTG
ncbi:hypothetical protein [Arthrobacter sp. H14-L1]|uniref:hypothetical protein n=1 Tax=Arthrobacter sp. H14-L1 TaxID=2996697 RepID=UPI0022722D71|nr:hypothetical protein [Arthrobacter sp. H14-L1]MCY0906412.1 hypothetical protein [Arthrobacter sp. H14-L1]